MLTALAQRSRITRKYGFHMPEQTNWMPSDNGLPISVKNCSKLSAVRSLPIHSSRVQPCSIC
jgi:hypothetical protein